MLAIGDSIMIDLLQTYKNYILTLQLMQKLSAVMLLDRGTTELPCSVGLPKNV